MIYLSGAILPRFIHPRLGWMVTPEMGNKLPDRGYFGIDNGCFSHPERFDRDRYADFVIKKIEEAPGRCLFATAPDVMGDHLGTLRQFEAHAEQLSATGAPVALVGQPGLGVEDVPWRDVDALFLGGGTAWRSGQEAHALALEAQRRGLWVHMGMVNTTRRIKAAQSMGCDSVDGTFLKYGPDKLWPTLHHWLELTGKQPALKI